MRKQMIIAVVMLAGLLAGGKQGWAAEQPHVEVKNLRCESLNSPLGIDVAKPRLSWRIESAGRGQRQSAYQVLVASNPKLLAAVGTQADSPEASFSGGGTDLLSRLKPKDGQPLHFAIAGEPNYSFIPYWEVPTNFNFTCFPVCTAKQDNVSTK